MPALHGLDPDRREPVMRRATITSPTPGGRVPVRGVSVATRTGIRRRELARDRGNLVEHRAQFDAGGQRRGALLADQAGPDDRDAEAHSAGTVNDSHLAALAASLGCETMRCHHDRLESLGLRSHEPGVGGGDHDARVGELRERATVASYPAHQRCAAVVRQQHRLDEVHADAPSQVAAADAEHEDAVVGAQPRRAQPVRVRAVPAVVVDPRGELRDVVADRVGLEVAELAEVARGVRRVPGPSAGAAEEQASAPFACCGEHVDDGFDRRAVEVREHGPRVVEESLSERAHGHFSSRGSDANSTCVARCGCDLRPSNARATSVAIRASGSAPGGLPAVDRSHDLGFETR